MDAIFLKLVEVGGLAFALVCVGLLALIRGDVVTKKSHEALLAEKDRAIAREQANGVEALRYERSQREELWLLLKPMLVVAQSAIERLEQLERPERGDRRH